MGGTVKIFKKCSPNGRVYLYMGNREFVSCDGVAEPVTGIVYVYTFQPNIFSVLFSKYIKTLYG